MRPGRLKNGALALALAVSAPAAGAGGPTFHVVLPASLRSTPLTGRLLVVAAVKDHPEPRLQVRGEEPTMPAVFGTDVNGLEPGDSAVVDSSAVGYPTGLAGLAPGRYCVQAVVVTYTHVRRSDGHELWVPFNDGRRAFPTERAGDLYSEPRCLQLGPGSSVTLTLNRVVPVPPPIPDTKWVKQVTVQSRKLTKFWGRPVYIHAKVLLPRGYQDHPDVRYPVIYALGQDVPFEFTTDSTTVHGLGKIDPVTGLRTGYDFYKAWASDSFPRFVAVTFHQQTPFFLDSYSVNSANNGPYGDAVVDEVIPALERKFRIIRKPYAQILEGASTGGWQTLALQLRHPKRFGGAWVLQPDPIDFRDDQQIDAYQDRNAFRDSVGPVTWTARPFKRSVKGQVVWTERQTSRFEAVMGDRDRSGYQLDAWDAIYGPVGQDGYPKPLWNKLTGKIDHGVAIYMRDHGYDLRAYAAKNWARIGPELVGKLHFFAGDMDNYYLNLGVYRFEAFLKSTKNPHYEASFTYGRPMKGHAWHAFTWSQFVRRVARYVRAHAPPGASLPEGF